MLLMYVDVVDAVGVYSMDAHVIDVSSKGLAELISELKTLNRFVFFCSLNAHSMLIFCYFLLYFLVNWFYFLYKGLSLGENCLIVKRNWKKNKSKIIIE